MFFNKPIETLPLPQLRALQNERLRSLLPFVYAKISFYRKAFDEKGINPTKIRSVEDLPLLPITRKRDLRDNYPFGMFTMPTNQLARIHCSSGTTGKPTVVGYTKADLEIFAEVNARSLATAGARPGMMLHNAYGYGLFTGGLGLHVGAEKLGMNVVPVSGGMTDRQLMLLQDFRPEVICCTPSYAQRLSEEVKRRNIPFEALNLKYAVLGAEPWTESIRADVEKGLNLKATNIYGLSEIIGPGVSQEPIEEQGSGSHIWEDHFFPEILDPETAEPMPEGKDGVLVITTLTKEANPLIRYWTGDICSLHYDKDSQRTHVKMSAIKGRADDMLIIRGVNFFPTQLEALIQHIPELIPHYQVVVSREKSLDEVMLKIEVSEHFQQKLQLASLENIMQHAEVEGLKQHFQKKIKENIGINMEVEIHRFGSIPRSDGGKLKRVLDLRN